jgi:hypothetical protein
MVGRIFLHTDLGKGLQATQLDTRRLRCERVGRINQPLGRSEFPLDVNDLRGFSRFASACFANRASHRLGQGNLLDLDIDYFNAPRIHTLIEDRLQPQIDLFATC